jgi:hypothetical protein
MVRTSLGLGVSGRSPHRSEAEGELDEELRHPTYYNTDVKDKISSSATGSLPTSSFPTRSFPSEYAASPPRHPYAHNDVRTVSASEPSVLAYDDRESGTGFRPEKMQIELEYDPWKISGAPTASFGTAQPSSSGQQRFDNEKLQPVRYSTEQV